MHSNGYSDHKPNVLRRLKRVEGQIRGVSSMVDNDAYCIDVLTQISAAQAALEKVALELVRDHAAHCLAQPSDEAGRREKLDELMRVIGRLR